MRTLDPPVVAATVPASPPDDGVARLGGAFGLMDPDVANARRRLHAAFLSAYAVALVATLAFASSYDFTDARGPSLGGLDKLAHFLTFGLMGTLWFRALPLPFASKRRFLWAWGLVLLYGVIDEWIQAGNPSRRADPFDWVADASGSLLAIFLYRNWTWYRNFLETPLRALLAKACRPFSNAAR